MLIQATGRLVIVHCRDLIEVWIGVSIILSGLISPIPGTYWKRVCRGVQIRCAHAGLSVYPDTLSSIVRAVRGVKYLKML